MWRGFFLACGVTLCILGAECLAVERVTLTDNNPPPSATSIGYTQPSGWTPNREYKPPEWAPWTMISAGAVVILYSFTIPKRVAGA